MKVITVQSHVPNAVGHLSEEELISFIRTGRAPSYYKTRFDSATFSEYRDLSDSCQEVFLNVTRQAEYLVVRKSSEGVFLPGASFFNKLLSEAKLSWVGSWCHVKLQVGEHILCVSLIRKLDDREQNQGTCITQIT
jgi:hypothetical protein